MSSLSATLEKQTTEVLVANYKRLEEKLLSVEVGGTKSEAPYQALQAIVEELESRGVTPWKGCA